MLLSKPSKSFGHICYIFLYLPTWSVSDHNDLRMASFCHRKAIQHSTPRALARPKPLEGIWGSGDTCDWECIELMNYCRWTLLRRNQMYTCTVSVEWLFTKLDIGRVWHLPRLHGAPADSSRTIELLTWATYSSRKVALITFSLHGPGGWG